jgi:methionyl-tRNA formyltransferase
MKIVLWIRDEANQKALANKIHSKFPVTGIVTEKPITKRKITFSKIYEKIYEKIFLPNVGKSWSGMHKYYDSIFKQYPEVIRIDVENINSEEAFKFTKDLEPDLIIVSGTRLVKEQMLSIKPSIGILNLHTGLSPYIKGGPNCTNWCIATEQYHLIGNTIMWIDIGIDTGNILTTEFTKIFGKETLEQLHVEVMNHAHDLYIKAITFLAQGNKNSIKQSSIAKGKTYYSKDWTLKAKINLVRNFHRLNEIVKTGLLTKLREGIQEFKI